MKLTVISIGKLGNEIFILFGEISLYNIFLYHLLVMDELPFHYNNLA